MRYKKHSHFRLYVVSTLIAFLIPTIISVSVVIINKKKYLESIIAYINNSSPINIHIEDINISYNLYLVLDNIQLYSKNDYKNNFFYLDKASIRINPLRLLKTKEIVNLVSEININNAYFYPMYFDKSILSVNKNSNNINADEVKEIIKIVSKSLYDKKIFINHFISEIIDNNDRKTIVSLNTFTANFQTKKYFINYSIDIPDNTTIQFLIESDTNLVNLNSVIKGYDDNRDLFEYDIKITNDFNTVKAEIYRNTDSAKIFNALYEYNNKLDFECINLNINKNAVKKLMSIALDTPIIYNFVKVDDNILKTASNTINSFQYATINFNGKYSKEDNLSLNLNLKSRDDLFYIVLDSHLTNQNLIISNSILEILNGKIIANASIPITNIYNTKAYLNIKNIKVGENNLSSRMSIRPLRNRNDNEYSSLFTIHALSYISSLQDPLSWNIVYNKKDKNININQIVALYDNPFSKVLYTFILAPSSK